MDDKVEEEELYEVECFLNTRKMPDGIRYYKVRWKGYPPGEDSWEPEENVKECTEALDAFWSKRQKVKKKCRYNVTTDNVINSQPSSIDSSRSAASPVRVEKPLGSTRQATKEIHYARHQFQKSEISSSSSSSLSSQTKNDVTSSEESGDNVYDVSVHSLQGSSQNTDFETIEIKSQGSVSDFEDLGEQNSNVKRVSVISLLSDSENENPKEGCEESVILSPDIPKAALSFSSVANKEDFDESVGNQDDKVCDGNFTGQWLEDSSITENARPIIPEFSVHVKEGFDEPELQSIAENFATSLSSRENLETSAVSCIMNSSQISQGLGSLGNTPVDKTEESKVPHKHNKDKSSSTDKTELESIKNSGEIISGRCLCKDKEIPQQNTSSLSSSKSAVSSIPDISKDSADIGINNPNEPGLQSPTFERQTFTPRNLSLSGEGEITPQTTTTKQTNTPEKRLDCEDLSLSAKDCTTSSKKRLNLSLLKKRKRKNKPGLQSPTFERQTFTPRNLSLSGEGEITPQTTTTKQTNTPERRLDGEDLSLSAKDCTTSSKKRFNLSLQKKRKRKKYEYKEAKLLTSDEEDKSQAKRDEFRPRIKLQYLREQMAEVDLSTGPVVKPLSSFVGMTGVQESFRNGSDSSKIKELKDIMFKLASGRENRTTMPSNICDSMSSSTVTESTESDMTISSNEITQQTFTPSEFPMTSIEGKVSNNSAKTSTVSISCKGNEHFQKTQEISDQEIEKESACTDDKSLHSDNSRTTFSCSNTNEVCKSMMTEEYDGHTVTDIKETLISSGHTDSLHLHKGDIDPMGFSSKKNDFNVGEVTVSYRNIEASVGDEDNSVRPTEIIIGKTNDTIADTHTKLSTLIEKPTDAFLVQSNSSSSRTDNTFTEAQQTNSFTDNDRTDTSSNEPIDENKVSTVYDTEATFETVDAFMELDTNPDGTSNQKANASQVNQAATDSHTLPVHRPVLSDVQIYEDDKSSNQEQNLANTEISPSQEENIVSSFSSERRTELGTKKEVHCEEIASVSEISNVGETYSNVPKNDNLQTSDISDQVHKVSLSHGETRVLKNLKSFAAKLKRLPSLRRSNSVVSNFSNASYDGQQELESGKVENENVSEKVDVIVHNSGKRASCVVDEITNRSDSYLSFSGNEDIGDNENTDHVKGQGDSIDVRIKNKEDGKEKGDNLGERVETSTNESGEFVGNERVRLVASEGEKTNEQKVNMEESDACKGATCISHDGRDNRTMTSKNKEIFSGESSSNHTCVHSTSIESGLMPRSSTSETNKIQRDTTAVEKQSVIIVKSQEASTNTGIREIVTKKMTINKKYTPSQGDENEASNAKDKKEFKDSGKSVDLNLKENISCAGSVRASPLRDYSCFVEDHLNFTPNTDKKIKNNNNDTNNNDNKSETEANKLKQNKKRRRSSFSIVQEEKRIKNILIDNKQRQVKKNGKEYAKTRRKPVESSSCALQRLNDKTPCVTDDVDDANSSHLASGDLVGRILDEGDMVATDSMATKSSKDKKNLDSDTGENDKLVGENDEFVLDLEEFPLANLLDEELNELKDIPSPTVSPLNVSYAELKQFIRDGDEMSVRAALNGGTELNVLDGASGMTLLMVASAACQDNIVELLLRRRADVNAVQKSGMTALMHACEQGSPETAHVLLMCGADINKQQIAGETALMQACKKGHTDVVEVLLKHGASTKLKTKAGRTALDFSPFDEMTILLDNHDKRLSKAIEQAIKTCLGDPVVLCKPPVLPYQCLAPREGQQFLFPFHYSQIQPLSVKKDVILFCIKANFHEDCMSLLFGEDNGVRGVLLNLKSQIPLLSGIRSIFAIDPRKGNNTITILTHKATTNSKLIVCIYAVQAS